MVSFMVVFDLCFVYFVVSSLAGVCVDVAWFLLFSIPGFPAFRVFYLGLLSD